jgi:hypothetical protein
MKSICGAMEQQAHHVVPGRSFRTGGPPSYDDGLAVCVESNRMGPDAEHSRIHNQYFDPQASYEAANSSSPGFIPLSRAEDLGSEALEIGTDGRSNREYIRQFLRRYHHGRYGMEPDMLVRGQKGPLSPTQAPNLGNQGAHDQLRFKGDVESAHPLARPIQLRRYALF